MRYTAKSRYSYVFVAYATYYLRDMKFLGLFWSILVLVATQPIEKGNQMGAFQYLLNYGYIADDGNSDVAAAMSEDMIIQAIMDFQVSYFTDSKIIASKSNFVLCRSLLD